MWSVSSPLGGKPCARFLYLIIGYICIIEDISHAHLLLTDFANHQQNEDPCPDSHVPRGHFVSPWTHRHQTAADLMVVPWKLCLPDLAGKIPAKHPFQAAETITRSPKHTYGVPDTISKAQPKYSPDSPWAQGCASKIESGPRLAAGQTCHTPDTPEDGVLRKAPLAARSDKGRR